MSINEEDFRASLENRLSNLSPQEKIHSLYRITEKLRLVHNKVGAVTEMRRDMTISEFQVAFPTIYNKLKDGLSQYVVGDYLSQAGWKYFEDNIFESRDIAARILIAGIRVWFGGNTSTNELDPLE